MDHRLVSSKFDRHRRATLRVLAGNGRDQFAGVGRLRIEEDL
jgi:hypothetical protein